MNEIMLRVENVSKRYKLGQIGGTTLRDELQRKMAKIKGKEDPTRRIGAKNYNQGETFMALNGVSFDVKKGERVGIIGHNGAGKSTLLKLISRVTAPTEGKIQMNGRVASMLEVGTGFHGELTGRENIYMNGAILGMTKKEIDAKIEDIIEFSEVREFIDTPVKRYSSGMYVKLAFSVAAHLDSEIMIMDEVLAVGDMAFQKKCLNKMNDVSKMKGRTILYVSHNMNTIRQLCERVIVLDHGKIVFNGDVSEGIGVYLNVATDTRLAIDYADEPQADWIIDPGIKILRVEFLDKSDNHFAAGEKIKVKLEWLSLLSNVPLQLRLEIHRLDQSAVTSGFTEIFMSGELNRKKSSEFHIETASLVPGKYVMIYAFVVINSVGDDCVTECRWGLSFEIIDDSIVWNTPCWGSTRLPTIEIKEIDGVQ